MVHGFIQRELADKRPAVGFVETRAHKALSHRGETAETQRVAVSTIVGNSTGKGAASERVDRVLVAVDKSLTDGRQLACRVRILCPVGLGSATRVGASAPEALLVEDDTVYRGRLEQRGAQTAVAQRQAEGLPDASAHLEFLTIAVVVYLHLLLRDGLGDGDRCRRVVPDSHGRLLGMKRQHTHGKCEQ